MTRLSILMPALEGRREMRAPLVEDLKRQVGAFDDGLVEFLVDEDDGVVPSGAKRNRLILRSRGDYFVFVDDDDTVAEDYVRKLFFATDTRAECISFLVRQQMHGTIVLDLRTTYTDAEKTVEGRLRFAANHLCAWRRDVGTQVAFPPNLGYNDDCFWYKPLLASGIVKTEHHIDEVLYHYTWHVDVTQNQRPIDCQYAHEWAAGGVDFFWWEHCGEREIVSALCGRNRVPGGPRMCVRDRWSQEFEIERSRLALFCTVKAH